MRHRSLVVAMMCGMLLVLSAVEPTPVVGQGAKPYSPQRLPDGHPDLQGTYDLATLTPLERPAGMKAVLTREEVAKLERAVAAQVDEGAKPISGERAAPPKGGDGSAGAAGNVGGYNSFWLDPGSTFTIVNGEIRTSIVVDPPDGRLPQLTPAARQRIAARLLAGAGQPNNDRGLETAPGAYDDPERRPLGERCLLGFGSTSGPPALPNYFYNNLHKIVQTPDTVMILNEMVHDARIVRMNAQHLPQTHSQVDGRFGRPLGRRHARRRHDELQRRSDRMAVQSRRAAGCSWLKALARRIGSRPSQDLHVIERFTAWRTTRCCIASRSRIRQRGSRRGPANSPGRRPTSTFTSTRATRRTTRWKTSCAERGGAKRTPRSEENQDNQ